MIQERRKQYQSKLPSKYDFLACSYKLEGYTYPCETVEKVWDMIPKETKLKWAIAQLNRHKI